jgi:hypothetical protein
LGLRAVRELGAALATLIGIGGGQALASAGCDVVNAGEFDQTIIGEGGGTSTIHNFAIGDTVTFVVANVGGVWQLISGNGTSLATVMTGRHTVPHIVTSADDDTTLQSIVSSAGSPVTVTATCTPAMASQD